MREWFAPDEKERDIIGVGQNKKGADAEKKEKVQGERDGTVCANRSN